MAINKATLAKKIDGVIEYIYPKTLAELVMYGEDSTIIEEIDNVKNISANALKQVTNLNNTKVDKENGKGLSTNDFTDDYKNRIDSLDDYSPINISYDEITNTLIIET